MSIRKIVAFTGIRSDYDLLSRFYKKILDTDGFELKLIVGGAHLSKRMGYTIQEIINDEIPILSRVESLLDSDSFSSRVKSLSILMQSSTDIIADYNPDLIIVVGDREEVLVGATIGTYLKIPVAHFFGGDHTTGGHVDNPIRHATSKLANIHFVSNRFSEQRLLAMGEEKRGIFNIGSPSLDKFKDTVYMSKTEVLGKLGIPNNFNEYALLIFHPEAGDERKSGEYLNNILHVLEEKNIFTFVSYPNSDGGYSEIISVLEKYKYDENFYIYKNLPREIFVNVFRNCSFVIGNSSMGIYEAPLLKKPVINIGNRQIGRFTTSNVQFIGTDKVSITQAILKLDDKSYQEKLKNIESIYGDGNSSERAIEILKQMDFREYLYKKYDPLGVTYE
ncbi:UDP-N-acetylglucosamine 2-epimerase [Metasolibacillus fluoroglycofenilyticus]|uniref:UDP-N-acetylglucosamine 2-epimerase n=1 Tax=Metasolibacillus fluoroglycofenilyticus TaxID=1239396 RepID=UPI000D3411CC|nr:UDP-N-acetylglucosamine 2-epimerase [Metasolibacillus fluoroglycofenilyticus]